MNVCSLHCLWKIILHHPVVVWLNRQRSMLHIWLVLQGLIRYAYDTLYNVKIYSQGLGIHTAWGKERDKEGNVSDRLSKFEKASSRFAFWGGSFPTIFDISNRHLRVA